MSSSPSAPDAGLRRIGEMLTLSRAARALTSAVALGVFDALADSSLTADRLAQQLKSNPRNTRVLLDALVSLELLAKAGEVYSNTPMGKRYLVSGGPESLANNLHYQELLAPAWAQLPEIVRSGKPAVALGDLLSKNPAFTREYIRGMIDISKRPAAELASQLDLRNVRAMLDAGGGPGVYVQAILERSPSGAKAVLLDLPPTLELAKENLASSPHRGNIELRPGNYHEADFGRETFDLILFSHVTHDEGEAANEALIRKAVAALRPGGRVVIHDFMLDTDRTSPLFGTLFSLHMLVYTQQGRTYSAEEYRSWMRANGLGNLRQIDVCPGSPNATQALIGTKP
jgi:SAM-dependent methyltransferase